MFPSSITADRLQQRPSERYQMPIRHSPLIQRGPISIPTVPGHRIAIIVDAVIDTIDDTYRHRGTPNLLHCITEEANTIAPSLVIILYEYIFFINSLNYFNVTCISSHIFSFLYTTLLSHGRKQFTANGILGRAIDGQSTQEYRFLCQFRS